MTKGATWALVSVFVALTVWKASTLAYGTDVSAASNRIATSTIPNAGRGVFAGRAYDAGELVERSPWIELTNVGFVSAVGLNTYVFQGPDDAKQQVLLLGHGGLFNHASPPRTNVRYGPSPLAERCFDFSASRRIERGEEMFIHYGYDPS